MIGTTADKYNKRIIVCTQSKMEDHNSILKGATELKFVLFCSSLDALEVGILFLAKSKF